MTAATNGMDVGWDDDELIDAMLGPADAEDASLNGEARKRVADLVKQRIGMVRATISKKRASGSHG